MLKVGDPVWVFDSNHREYAEGTRWPPLHRASWRPGKIVAETHISWDIVVGGWAAKVDKKTLHLRVKDLYGKRARIAASQNEVDQDVWRNDHQQALAELLGRSTTSMAQLRAVAEVLGYEPKPPIDGVPKEV